MSEDEPSSHGADRDLLDARARLLARPPEARRARGREEDLELLSFTAFGERFAVESRYVHEVVTFRELSRLPGVHPVFLGLMSHQAEVLPVIDPTLLLGGIPRVEPWQHVLVLGRSDGELGLAVSSAEAVTTIAADAITDASGAVAVANEGLVRGAYEGTLILKGDAILDDPRTIIRRAVAHGSRPGRKVTE